MRKQNSEFKTSFISEAGSELENNDYFAYVELDKYACYVMADGLSEQPDAESAKLAIQTILLSFQEKPSIGKSALLSYLKAGNRALAEEKSKNRLKASVVVILSDYQKIRYGSIGNTRMRLYREGLVKEQSKDMSLGNDMVALENKTKDALASHEERNNLYAWLGQEKGFTPFISPKIKLEKGDIITLYTRGIWENLDEGELDDVFSEAKDDPQECLDNIEELLLSKQPQKLQNYTFAAIFADKIFLDPNRKRRIKKIVTITIIVLVVLLIAGIVFWIVHHIRMKRIETMNQSFADTIEYVQDGNFTRAEEECKTSLEMAEKLWDKKMQTEASDYLKLIEAVNQADEQYADEKYEEAQKSYQTAKERSRYADQVADSYIDQRLNHIVNYLSVFDYIQMGDTLTEQANYDAAEEKYLTAKSLATQTYYEEGRKEAMSALEQLYEKQSKEAEADNQEAKEKAADETSAAEQVSQGDQAFASGDYETARIYYATALEKYQQLADSIHEEVMQTKISSIEEKIAEKEEKEKTAEEYLDKAQAKRDAGDLTEAKKLYLFAKKIYKETKNDDKVAEVDASMELLEMDIEEHKEKAQAAEQAITSETVSGSET